MAIPRRKHRAPKSQRTCREHTPRTLNEAEIAALREAMKRQLNGKEPREFQIDMVKAQEERRDALCHAATGMGKTLIAAAPHALEHNRGRVTLMVSPLIALQNEMVSTFKEEYNVSAIAINSAHGGCSAKVLSDIGSGTYQIVLLSPEMLLSRRFISRVLRKRSFTSQVYSIVVDEAHCISHWGASFRKKYASIGMVRAFLPLNTPVVALSATLTPRVANDVIRKLQFPRANHLFFNSGNDRSNVSLVVRPIKNAVTTYSDLEFVICPGTTSISQIKKTWIYVDSIATGAEIIDYLRTLLPEHLHGTIRPYNAIHSHEYRALAMKGFREGTIRVLVCTDAAGMGCNVPDIDVVVQWKLPEKMSSFVQRAGRAARGPGTTGMAVLLAEPSAYRINAATKGKTATKSQKAQDRRNRQDSDNNSSSSEMEDAEDEGMRQFVQCASCRRGLLREIYRNPEPAPTVKCCDICDPDLLDHVKPGTPSIVTRKSRLTRRNEMDKNVAQRIGDWCEEIIARDFPNSFLSPSALLSNTAVKAISSLAPLSARQLEQFLEPQWHFWTRYGEDLVALLNEPEPEPADLTNSCANDPVAGEGRNDDIHQRHVRVDEPAVSSGQAVDGTLAAGYYNADANPSQTSTSTKGIPSTPAKASSKRQDDHAGRTPITRSRPKRARGHAPSRLPAAPPPLASSESYVATVPSALAFTYSVGSQNISQGTNSQIGHYSHPFYGYGHPPSTASTNSIMDANRQHQSHQPHPLPHDSFRHVTALSTPHVHGPSRTPFAPATPVATRQYNCPPTMFVRPPIPYSYESTGMPTPYAPPYPAPHPSLPHSHIPPSNMSHSQPVSSLYSPSSFRVQTNRVLDLDAYPKPSPAFPPPPAPVATQMHLSYAQHPDRSSRGPTLISAPFVATNTSPSLRRTQGNNSHSLTYSHNFHN